MFFFTSDLHYGLREDGDTSTRALAARLSDISAPHDILALIGDLATTDAALQECLALFRRFRGRSVGVPGNHDVWVDEASLIDSRTRYQRVLDTFVASGIHPLDREPIVIDGLGIAGCMGWYDYSFRDPRLQIPVDAYIAKQLPGTSGPCWGDVRFVRWSWSDAEVTERFARQLDEHLTTLRACREVVVCTHHLPTRRLLPGPRWLIPRHWRFTHAFLGSEQFAAVIARYANVRSAVSGHIHLAQSTTVNHCAFRTVGSTYTRKELLWRSGNRWSRLIF